MSAEPPPLPESTATPPPIPQRIPPPPLRGAAAEVRSLERHVCPECGGKGEWDPGKRMLVCPYCGSEFTRSAPPPQPSSIQEHDLDEMLVRLGEASSTVRTTQRSVQCSHCHAVLARDAAQTGLSRHEFQSNAIEAIAKTGWLWPVIKDMAKMAAAAAAMHLGAGGKQRIIILGADSARQHIKKARPAGAAVKFGFR